MRKLMFFFVLNAFLCTWLTGSAAAGAEGMVVPLDKAGTIKIDGVLKEWSAPLIPLNKRVMGNQVSSADLSVQVALAYDETSLYVAAEIHDKKWIRTAAYSAQEDHLSLLFAFPDETGAYSSAELELYPGDPGNVAGIVKAKGGASVAGAMLVEAPLPNRGGLTMEAKIPWSALPQANYIRCGLRGAIRYYDNDGKGIKNVISTAPEGPLSQLPRMPIESEQALEEGLVKDKQLTGSPRVDIVIDVTGDSMKERVLLWDHYVVVLSPHFRDGSQFFYNDLGTSSSMIPSFEVRDVTGDAKAEIILRKRFGSAAQWSEILQVLAMPADSLIPLFQHEVGVLTEQGSVSNTVKFIPDKSPGRMQIEIALGNTNGLSGATFKSSAEGAVEPALVPWGPVKNQTYQWDGSQFRKIRQESQVPGAVGAVGSFASKGSKSEATEPPPAPPPPRSPTPDEMQDQLLTLYKRDRSIRNNEKPRFDFVTNVAEDTRNERILVFGKDLVVFGKGFLGGTSYTSVTLGLADSRDVIEVTTRDLTGDGRAEILVRGVQHKVAPKELGKGQLERELLLIYSVQGNHITRVFAAETGISLGDRKISDSLVFVPHNPAFALVLGPGRAVGWNQKNWPYQQDTAPVSGIEPLVLPWAQQNSAPYIWNGQAFVH